MSVPPASECDSTRCVDLFDIDDSPKYDFCTFTGRMHYYFVTANPLNLLVPEEELHSHSNLVKKFMYKKEKFEVCVTVEEIQRSKDIYDSAFHPETTEKIETYGRMSSMLPISSILTGGMMAYQKSILGNIFWQGLNQFYNSFTIYSNANGSALIRERHAKKSAKIAAGVAVGTSLGLRLLAKVLTPIGARCTPFLAVAAGLLINVPLMRAPELRKGIKIIDNKDRPMGYSKVAARQAIEETTISRITMYALPMLFTPLITNLVAQRGTFCRYPYVKFPIHTSLLAICFAFSIPMGLALYPRKGEIKFKLLERKVKNNILKTHGRASPRCLYYNKGL